MMISKWLLALFVTLLAGCNMSGCSLLDTERFTDFEQDEEGNVTLLDTTRRWHDWREAVDPQIAAEIAGKSPPGFRTWNEKWTRQLTALQETQENAGRYISYIVERRRDAGLPEIEGFDAR